MRGKLITLIKLTTLITLIKLIKPIKLTLPPTPMNDTYSYDEAFKASLEYFQGDELAARVWVNKYAMKDSFGHIYERSPRDMHHRLASELARVESRYPNAMTEEEIFGDNLPVTVLSDILDTIPYEVLTSVSERVKRVYFQ